MPIIVIDGPEKAGKSTLAKYLADEYGYRIRKWGPIEKPFEMLEPLAKDIASGELVVWDRSWASECVYSVLEGRPWWFRTDWWMAEWTFGRAVMGHGLRVLLTGPDPAILAERRTDDDLPVDPAKEQEAYEAYGTRFHWYLDDGSDIQAIGRYAHHMADAMEFLANGRKMPVPGYAGPPNAKTVLVQSSRNPDMKHEGTWLPFTTPVYTVMARWLGNDAITKFGWTALGDFDIRESLATKVVAIGADVRRKLEGSLPAGVKLVTVPTPPSQLEKIALTRTERRLKRQLLEAVYGE